MWLLRQSLGVCKTIMNNPMYGVWLNISILLYKVMFFIFPTVTPSCPKYSIKEHFCFSSEHIANSSKSYSETGCLKEFIYQYKQFPKLQPNMDLSALDYDWVRTVKSYNKMNYWNSNLNTKITWQALSLLFLVKTGC